MIPSSALVLRCATGTERVPSRSFERRLFTDFLSRGLGVPVSPFLRKLLAWYGIQLHHLSPNSMR
jgi:hypothetical protein